MRGTTELVLARNVYYLAAVVVLASSLVGSASDDSTKPRQRRKKEDLTRSRDDDDVVVDFCFVVLSDVGSCLSYGHSCWGAHGKRSGNIVNALQQRPVESNVGAMQDVVRRMPPLDERWLLSRLVNRQQVPLVTRLRAARILDEDRPIMDKFENVDLKDLVKSDQKLIDDEPDNLLIPEQRDMSVNENDQAMRAGFYKILRNID